MSKYSNFLLWVESNEPDGTEYADDARSLIDRVAELVESEEKAWQKVAHLRVELGTTDRLRAQVAELQTEVDRMQSKFAIVAKLTDQRRGRDS